jgi:hypothetical protein
VDWIIEGSYNYFGSRKKDFVRELFLEVGVKLPKNIEKSKDLNKISWYYYKG